MVSFPSLTCCDVTTPLGPITLAASARGLAGAWFHDQRHRPTALSAQPVPWPRDEHHPLLREAARQLHAYFAGERQGFTLALDLSAGTPFQQAVWRALQALGHGQTTNYAALAHALGQPRAVRAVGGAVGRNPLSVVIPCHRVLGAGGALTGYAGGLARKQALLALEGAWATPPLWAQGAGA